MSISAPWSARSRTSRRWSTIAVTFGALPLSGQSTRRRRSPSQVTFAPAPNGNGLAVIQLQVFDGQDTTIATFKVNVIAVDDQPTFALLNPEVYALQDSGTVTVSNFCTSINPGAANEASQVLT